MNKEQIKQLAILLKLRFEELKKEDIEHPRYLNRLAIANVEKVMDDMCSEQREEYFPSSRKSCNNIPEEEVKERFMTYEEGSLWLTEKPHRQCISNGCSCIDSHLSYYKFDADKEAKTTINLYKKCQSFYQSYCGLCVRMEYYFIQRL